MARVVRRWLACGGMLVAVAGCEGSSASGDDDGGEGGAASGGTAGTGARGGTGGAGASGGAAGSGGSAGSGRGGGAGTATGGQSGAATGGTGTGGTAAGAAGSAAAGAGGQVAGGGGAGPGGEAGEAGAGAGAAGAPGDRWDGCPTADDYAGEESWTNTVEVTGDGVYCGTFDETRTLKEELAKKALLRVAPGTYRLPPAARENLGLPICIAYGEEGRGIPAVPGDVTYTAVPLSGDESHHYGFTGVAPAPDRKLGVDLYQISAGGEGFAFTLDGGPNAFDSFDSDSFGFVVCDSLEEPCYHDLRFDSCTHEGSTLNRHELTLADGTLVLDVRIGASAASTEPAAFVRGAGTFRGTSFEQTDYFHLIYRPAHHHFERDFAVLFDAPIDGVCGVQIEGFSAFDEVTPIATAVNCELDPLESLVVTAYSLTRDP